MADKDITTLSGFSFSQAKENVFEHESEILLRGELGRILRCCSLQLKETQLWAITLTFQCIIIFALSFKRWKKYCPTGNVSRGPST